MSLEPSALSACLLAARCFSSWTSLTSGHHHHHHHHQWTATIIKTFTITITTTIINTFIVDVFILFVIIVISIALLSSNQNRSSLMAGSLYCGQFGHSNYFHHHHHHHQNQLGEDGLLHLICWSCRREHLPVYVHWGQVRDPNLEKIIMFSQQVHQGQDWTSLVISCGEALATPARTNTKLLKKMHDLTFLIRGGQGSWNW